MDEARLRVLGEDADDATRLAAAQILYTDLDGTMLGRGGALLADASGAPSLLVAGAVTALNAAGLIVVPTSGRNRLQLFEMVRLLGWHDYIAELGGVIVRDRGAYISYDLGDWPAGTLREGETPYEVIARTGAVDALREAFPGRIEAHAPYHLNREVTHLLRGGLDIAAAQGVLDGVDGPPVEIADNGIINPRHHTLVGVNTVHAYHLIPKGMSKRRAVERDLRERGLTHAGGIAIGDSVTDVQIAESVGLMALVRDALQDYEVVAESVLHDSVRATRAEHGAGWVELANAWLAAKGLAGPLL